MGSDAETHRQTFGGDRMKTADFHWASWSRREKGRIVEARGVNDSRITQLTDN